MREQVFDFFKGTRTESYSRNSSTQPGHTRILLRTHVYRDIHPYAPRTYARASPASVAGRLADRSPVRPVGSRARLGGSTAPPAPARAPPPGLSADRSPRAWWLSIARARGAMGGWVGARTYARTRSDKGGGGGEVNRWTLGGKAHAKRSAGERELYIKVEAHTSVATTATTAATT